MKRVVRSLSTVVLTLGLSPVIAAGDGVPRTASGRPDLTGNYNAATVTPLQRPETLRRQPLSQRGGGRADRGQHGRANRGDIPGQRSGSRGATRRWRRIGRRFRQRRRLQLLLARPGHRGLRGGRQVSDFDSDRSTERSFSTDDRERGEAFGRDTSQHRARRQRRHGILAREGRTRTLRRSGVAAGPGALHRGVHRRRADAPQRVQQLQDDRPDRGPRHDPDRDGPRRARGADEVRGARRGASAVGDQEVGRRFDRVVGGRHVGRRHDELPSQGVSSWRLVGDARGRALDQARGRRRALPLHRGRSLIVDSALDRRVSCCVRRPTGSSSTPATRGTTPWGTSCAALACSRRTRWGRLPRVGTEQIQRSLRRRAARSDREASEESRDG